MAHAPIQRSNTEIMRSLFRDKVIRSEEPAFIYKAPKRFPVAFSRIEGMLLGIAIGDSLGNTSELLSINQRNKRYGLITDYLPNKHVGNEKIGLPSDDTQLAFDTVKVVLENGYLDLDNLARTFSSHRIFGIGGVVKRFLKHYKDEKRPWYMSGVVNGSGNGALMRIAPAILPYLKSSSENPWADTILDTMLTHNGALSIGTSVAFIEMLMGFLSAKRAPDTSKLVAQFVSTMSMFTGNTKYAIRSAKARDDFPHDAAGFIEQSIKYAERKGLTIKGFSDMFGSGAYVLETAAALLYILTKYLNEPQEAIIQAANYASDNDTIGAIVGAAVGALYGKEAFRDMWISNLSGRIRESDDGAVFYLIKETQKFLNDQ